MQSSLAPPTDSGAPQLSPAETTANRAEAVGATSSVQKLPDTSEVERSRIGASKRPKCRFFKTKRGCRAGDNCPFRHDVTTESVDATQKVTAQQGTAVAARADAGNPNVHHQVLSSPSVPAQPDRVPEPVDTTAANSPATHAKLPQRYKPVPRPISKLEQENPRKWQIQQIRIRFQAQEVTLADGASVLKFKAPVTDPDFPFDLSTLDCTLTVPIRLMEGDAPKLKVSNPEMERGYQVNVEQGFQLIWSQSARPNLLNTMNALDRKLEAILTAKKADIIKIVTPAKSTEIVQKQVTSLPQVPEASREAAHMVAAQQFQNATPPPPKLSAEHMNTARLRRETETRMLESRLGRHTRFSKSADGIAYTVPVELRKSQTLPSSLQDLTAARLIVPLSYDIDPCRIELLGVHGDEGRRVERAFLKRATELRKASLLAHVNYLSQNIQHMISKENDAIPAEADTHLQAMPESASDKRLQSIGTPTTSGLTRDTEKAHVKLISRPPEWDQPRKPEKSDARDSDSYDTTSSDYDESDSSDDDDSDKQAEDAITAAAQNPVSERGTMISFPALELYSIELLELATLNITVKCERCKELVEVRNLKHNAANDHTGMTSVSCRKCGNPIGAGFRADLMHANSIRAGYLDLEGATIADLLPCHFTPTCAECSTPVPAPGVTAVRGDAAIAICRHCHRKMTFKLPQTKFLRISAAAIKAHHGLPRRRKKDDEAGLMGLVVAGTELPRRGRCRHYAKSHRWFRFSCCSQVFPCDRCHDEHVRGEHVQEFANRMICGYCSREQNYRPEDCGVCRRALTGRTGSGFWEGGKGTRDRVRMSRKDPRKFKRRQGNAPVGGAKRKAKKKEEASKAD